MWPAKFTFRRGYDTFPPAIIIIIIHHGDTATLDTRRVSKEEREEPTQGARDVCRNLVSRGRAECEHATDLLVDVERAT